MGVLLASFVRERMQRVQFFTAIVLGALRQGGREVRTPPNVVNQKKSFNTAEPCQRRDWFLNT
jgi:hypothetical protein